MHIPENSITDSVLFEETLAVKFPRALHGYRGSMGDFIMLKSFSVKGFSTLTN